MLLLFLVLGVDYVFVSRPLCADDSAVGVNFDFFFGDEELFNSTHFRAGSRQETSYSFSSKLK